jgi:hypothetical protein
MHVWPRRRRRAPCQFAIDALASTDELVRESIYQDGTYLISEWGEARTWAVHQQGRWGVVYEWLGEQPLAGWVSADQIPIEVRAQALHRTADGPR